MRRNNHQRSTRLRGVPYNAFMLAEDTSWYATIGGTPAIVTTVAAIIITVYVSRYYANKGKIVKALGWTPLSINLIVTRPVTDLSEGLALTWKGKALRTPYIVRLRILNARTREIVGAETDYLEPLFISFSSSTCYEAIITQAHGTPVKLPTSIISNPSHRFQVSMPTLNMSSWIDIEMIADGEAEYPGLTCVLVGETQPIATVAGRQRSRLRSLALAIGSLGVVVFTVGFGLLGFQSYTNLNGPTIWPLILIVIGSLVWVSAGASYLMAWWLDRQERIQAKRMSQAPPQGGEVIRNEDNNEASREDDASDLST